METSSVKLTEKRDAGKRKPSNNVSHPRSQHESAIVEAKKTSVSLTKCRVRNKEGRFGEELELTLFVFLRHTLHVLRWVCASHNTARVVCVRFKSRTVTRFALILSKSFLVAYWVQRTALFRPCLFLPVVSWLEYHRPPGCCYRYRAGTV